MARASSPNNTAPNVWNDDADDFDHSQLAANWDALDEQQAPLGSIVMWWRATSGRPNVPWSTGSVWQPCDGRTILSANHDMGGGDLILPDLRGYVLMGSQNPDNVSYPGDGNAGTANSNTNTNAPGIRGTQGDNSLQTVPAHYHDFSHVHVSGNVAGVETGPAVNDDPADSPHFSGSGWFINTDASGTGNAIPKTAHAHQLKALYSSTPRDPAQANIRVVDAPTPNGSLLNRTGTSLQKKTDGTNGQTGSGNTGSTTITPGGGTAGDNLQVSPVQHSYGVVYLMKVRVTPR